MFDEEDREVGYALFLAIAVAISVSLFTIAIAAGSAIGQFGQKPAARSSAATLPVNTAAAASGAAMMAPAAVATAATARLYFELAKFELPADALTQLSPLLAAAKDKPASTWVISGYHDASGDAAANAELAKRRAFAVRDLLVTAGVRENDIELSKPIVTLGGADPREARRVEVTLR
jgi:outer membrane protein OmpA-like peptidoglycan-associated protein